MGCQNVLPLFNIKERVNPNITIARLSFRSLNLTL